MWGQIRKNIGAMREKNFLIPIRVKYTNRTRGGGVRRVYRRRVYFFFSFPPLVVFNLLADSLVSVVS